MKPMQWRHALCSSGLDPTARLVAHVVGVFMGGSGESWPDKETIRDSAGLSSVRTVDGAIHRIEQAGYLIVVRSRGGQKSNHYYATTPQHGAGLTLHDGAGLSEKYPASGRQVPRSRASSTPHPGAGEIDEVVEVGDAASLSADADASLAITDNCLGCGDDFSTTAESTDAYCPACRAVENGAAPVEELAT